MASANQEEEVRKLSVQIRYLEQTAEGLQQRLSMMNAAFSDLTYANVTLENVESEKVGAEMLVPIGGSSYISVKLADANKVVVGLGSGVSVEKTLPEAKVVVKERLDELEKSRVQTSQQLSQVVERLGQDRSKLDSLLSSVSEGQQ